MNSLAKYHHADLVCLQLLILTGQGDVEEVLVLPELPEGPADIRLEIIPPQTELFRRHRAELHNGCGD